VQHVSRHATMQSWRMASIPHFQGVKFLRIELNLAISFCHVGLTARDLVRAERNADNERLALRTALRVKERVFLDERARQVFAEKTSKVASLLARLEDHCAQLLDK
jgi:hypothetical protein